MNMSDRFAEMGSCTAHLKSLVKDDLLPLQSDILGPLDESGEIALRGDVAACN